MEDYMKKMMNLLSNEVKRNLDKRLNIVLIVFLLLSIIALQSGVWKYNQEIGQINEFSYLQEKGMSLINDIRVLTIRGIDIISKSSPLIVLFSSSSPFKLLQSYMNDAEKLKIVSSHLGRSVLEGDIYKILDFPWLILIIGSLMVMAWGFGSFRNAEYIKFLSGFARLWQIHLGFVLARIFILILYLAVLTSVIIVQFFLNGIRLNGPDIMAILTFGLISLLVLTFILLIGVIAGAIKKTSKAIMTAFICWLCLIFLIPMAINDVFSRQPKNQTKSLYSHEIQKLEIFLEHYSLAKKEISQLGSMPEKIEAVKKWNERYWDSTFKKIAGLEVEMMTCIKEQADRLYFMNAFTPVSFYSSVNNEISSRGYNFLIAFYKHVQEKQKGFVRYYFDHIFDDYTKIEPYMKKGDYIFQARPSLPRYFGLGLIINLVYVLLAGILSFFCFKKVVFPRPQDGEAFYGLDLKYDTGKHYVFAYKPKDFPN